MGVQVVRRMNELGMMVDVSHLGEASFWQLMNITTPPVIASHSSVYTLCAHQRNLKDDQIKAIASNGGLIQVNFYSGFLDSGYAARKRDFKKRHEADVVLLKSKGFDE